MKFRANGKNHEEYEMMAVDVMTGEIINRSKTDVLIRHKWPEEKPNELGYYLVRMRSGIMAVLPFNDGCFYIDDYMLLNYMDTENPITHWWELPEVKE